MGTLIVVPHFRIPNAGHLGLGENVKVASGGRGGSTVRARMGRLSWIHAAVGGLVLMLVALAAAILMMQKPAPKTAVTAVAPPPVSAPVAGNPPASGAGAAAPESTPEPPKPSGEEVKSAEGNPSLTFGARIGAVGEAAKPAVSKPRADRPTGRPQEASIPPGAPLSVAEILTLLHAGTSSARVAQFVELRGAG